MRGYPGLHPDVTPCSEFFLLRENRVRVSRASEVKEPPSLILCVWSVCGASELYLIKISLELCKKCFDIS